VNERTFYFALLGAFAASAVVVFLVLWFVTAPYGRHARRGAGPKVSARLGWILMEAPAALSMALLFATGDRQGQATAIAFLALWELHYVNRAFVYPLRARGRPMPLLIALGGALFNLTNGYLNGRWLFSLSAPYPSAWLLSFRFLFGPAVFFSGLAVNQQSDAILRALRGPGDQGYRIPRGGLFRWVSCPNYLGEIVEWVGWAIATWSPAGAVFALWTVANLAPRARSHHRWYRERFPDYPPDRRALIPFIF